MQEIWKPVAKFETLYEVSNTGKVRRVLESFKDSKLTTPRTLKPFMTTAVSVNLYDKLHIKHTISIARLVATAFLSNPKECKYVLHIDGNLYNNSVDNLVWSTYAFTGNLKRVPKSCRVRCIESGQIYESMACCERALRLPRNSIYQYFKFKRKHVRNYTFEKV